MKKYLILSLLLIISLTGCQSSREGMALRGSDLPEELEGAIVYLVADSIGSDSVIIRDRSFTLHSETTSRTILGMISIPKAEIELPFIPESGDFTLLPDTDRGGYRIGSEDPSSLNAALQSYRDEVADRTSPLLEEESALEAKLERTEDPAQERQLRSQIDSLRIARATRRSEIAAEYYRDHKEDLLGTILFGELDFADEAEYVTLYEEASEAVRSDRRYTERYAKAQNALETSVGKSYKGDFEISDGEGERWRLSDFMDGKRYLLLDFWASWCVYCRQAMPTLARLSREHGDQIRILSIGVREKSKADNDRAKDALGITWETIYDHDNSSYDAYGVIGIPTLILISPKGEIVFRGYLPEQLMTKIEEITSSR